MNVCRQILVEKYRQKTCMPDKYWMKRLCKSLSPRQLREEKLRKSLSAIQIRVEIAAKKVDSGQTVDIYRIAQIIIVCVMCILQGVETYGFPGTFRIALFSPQ